MPLYNEPLSENITDSLNAADNPSATNAMVTVKAAPAFSDQRQFLDVIYFRTGVLPIGMSGSVSGVGASGTYTQVAEPGIPPGISLAVLTTTSLSRVSLLTSGQYMPTFIDAQETTFFMQMRWNVVPPIANAIQIIGWINSNSFTPVTSLGNALAIMYDPANASGFNPGLITNLFLIARANYNGPTATTVVDLGVTPDAVNYRPYKITYDNVLNEVRVYRSNVLLTTLTNLANVPAGLTRGLIPTGGTNGVAAGYYICNQGTPAAGSGIRVSKISVFKRYS